MKYPMKSLLIAVYVLALAGLCSAGSAWASTLSVTTLNDSGPGSLRQVIAGANAGDTITFDVSGTIALTSGPLVIDKYLDIEGPGAKQLAISGNHASRVFIIQNISSGNNVTLAGMTISDGLADLNSPFPQGMGGGILNLATGRLILSNVIVSNCQALGDASMSPVGYSGAGYGGGVANAGGILTVIDSFFVGNLARGGDGSVGPVAGLGGGGGIFNSGYALIERSRFTRNQAVGGDNCSGTILTGHAAAGALLSGGFTSTTLFVSDSVFEHNQAIGGNGNYTVVSGGLGPNKASGGAIDVTGGTATFDSCTMGHNLALGGAGYSGGDGGIGAGGGIMVTNVGYANSNATISNSRINHNKALGGPGGLGGDGGQGEGGGLTTIQGAALMVIDTTVEHNHAQGCESGAGGNGGNGLGGGLYEDAFRTAPPLPGLSMPSTLILENAIVRFNLALAGEAEDGGSDGQGIGGGVYQLGTYSADPATVIKKNQASTSKNNVGP